MDFKKNVYVSLWDDYKYCEKIAPNIDMQMCGSLSQKEEECLKALLTQTQEEVKTLSTPPRSEYLSMHTEPNGDIYYIGFGCVQKDIKNRIMVNTLNNHNELVQTPLNPEHKWFICSPASDND